MIKTVELINKFTSINFEKLIDNYWDDTFNSVKVVFDLSKLEWIANEQSAFLICWINQLWENEIKVSIIFQSSNEILIGSKEYYRRTVCYNQLINNWRFIDSINPKTELIDKGIKATSSIKNSKPYIAQPLINYNSKTFDSDFNELFNNNLDPFLKHVLIEISQHTKLSYFDNHFLNYSIIKEFYSNSCQHAFQDNKKQKCHFSINLNKKIEHFYGDILEEKLNERFSERPKEEISFFKEGKSHFINKSFIELTFFDLGEGISKTITENYTNEKFDSIKHKLGNEHQHQNEDTKALEYAFLLFTSRYEIGKDLEMHDYIPRGLFVIKEIVKKYNGMIVARSNAGKVVFNFAKNVYTQIHYREINFENKIITGFPGTSITIILPAIEKTDKSKILTKQKNKESLPKPYFVNLLEFINKTTNNKRIITEQSEIKKRILFFEIFFTNLTKNLISLNERQNIDKISKIADSVDQVAKINSTIQNEKILIMFDFAGIERSNQDIFNKFIYFLTYCPFISRDINVCLFNVLEKDINSVLIQDKKHLIKSKGFFSKPIPCIHPDLDISWLGVNDSELESILTSLWKIDDRKNKIYSDVSHLSSNIVEVEVEDYGHGIFKFNILISSYYELIEEIYLHHKKILSEEVIGKGIQFKELINDNHNYNLILNRKFDNQSKDQRAFLTSNSLYQKEFLTFIEKLYIREYRRFISVYLFYNFLFDQGVIIEDLKKTTKVLTVTLSSQLLGKEFVDIFNLLIEKETPIQLIPLSNYYDFNTEEAFNELNEEDQIIIVNDVISTGSLSRKIENSLTDKVSIYGFITIVDSRTIDEQRNIIKSNLTALLNKSIKKYKINPFPNTKPIWINPILNSPTSMSREKSNNKSILQSPQEFINNFDDDMLFKVGNFNHNTVYHSYFLNTEQFIKNELDAGFPIIKSLLNRLEDRLKSEQNTSLENDIIEITRIKKKYFSQEKSVRQIGGNATLLNNAFSKIENSLSKELIQKKQYDLFSNKKVQLVDFIFYPFLSSISEIEKNIGPLSVQLRGSKKIEVFPIPRIMTPRGWRFSFPPKFLNYYSKNKKALILDDGSCTGETLVQMIDSLSFLELSEINVLSIFARLEDFQREFLTRIKKIKVKDSENIYSGYKIIPLNVFFGTHFHIPVYTKSTHYNNIERNELEGIKRYYELKEEVLPIQLEQYIISRLHSISNAINVREDDVKFPEIVDKRTMFLIRDIIGNYDSYRLFKEDEFTYNDEESHYKELSFSEILDNIKGKYSLLAVINHEPSVINIIQRVYPEILVDLKSFCIDILHDENLSDLELIIFIFKGLVNIDINSGLNHNLLLSILEKGEVFGKGNVDLHNYIYFLFLNEKIKSQTNSEYEAQFNSLRILLKTIYNTINDNKLSDRGYFNLVKDLYGQFLRPVESTIIPKLKAMYKVQSYYSLQQINEGGKDVSSHPNAYLHLSVISNTLIGFTNIFPDEVEIDSFISQTDVFFKGLTTKLINPLKQVLDFLNQFYLKNDLSIEIDKYNTLILEFKRLHNTIKENNLEATVLSNNTNIKSTVKWLKDFQNSFFKMSTELPMFFTHESTNLKSVVVDVIEEYKLSKELNPKIQINIDESIKLRINSYLLRIIIYELVENKTKHAPNSDAHLNYTQDRDFFYITYNQNYPFYPKEENGLNTIRNIVIKYGGFCFISNTENYEFIIKFPLILKSK